MMDLPPGAMDDPVSTVWFVVSTRVQWSGARTRELYVNVKLRRDGNVTGLAPYANRYVRRNQ